MRSQRPDGPRRAGGTAAGRPFLHRLGPHRRAAGTDRAALRAELGIPAGAALIGAVGAIVPHKGHRHLLASMPKIVAAHPEAHLVLFGDGPLESELRRESWERRIQARVVFAGFRADDLVFSLPSTSWPIHRWKKDWAQRSSTPWPRDFPSSPPGPEGSPKWSATARPDGSCRRHRRRSWPGRSSLYSMIQTAA